MTPVFLLARKFVRQNRWLLLAFVALPLFLGALQWSPHHGASWEDIEEIVQQEMFYGVVIVTFLASSALYNEKRSRRIVGVLSKGVSREQYLLALLVGAAWFAAAYFGAVGAILLWLLDTSKTVTNAAITLFVRGLVAALWTASVGLLWSTLLHPFLAAAIATTIAFAPFALSHPRALLMPLTALLKGSHGLSQGTPVSSTLSAIVESALIFLLASQIFRRRDVTVNIE